MEPAWVYGPPDPSPEEQAHWEEKAEAQHEEALALLMEKLTIKRRGHALLFRLRATPDELTMCQSRLHFITEVGPVQFKAELRLIMKPCTHCEETGILEVTLRKGYFVLAELEAPLCKALEHGEGVFPASKGPEAFDDCGDFWVRFELEIVNE